MSKKLDSIFENSKKIVINDNTKLVIMSDCHRGVGDNFDNFIKNKTLFDDVLLYYYDNNYMYIELGDGDEMWEIKNYNEIVEAYLDTFKILKKFKDSNRLIMIYGNHDIEKKSHDTFKKYFSSYYDQTTEQYQELLNDLPVYESLVLKYKNYDIFLIHGHQVTFLSGTLWRFTRFLVRYVWKNFERIGIKDPTSAAKNYNITKMAEKKLSKWSIKNNKILISGHTHRPIFPKVGESLYFNDGCCIHPNGITSLEIENGTITLVKWELIANKDKSISAKRKVLARTEPIVKFFK